MGLASEQGPSNRVSLWDWLPLGSISTMGHKDPEVPLAAGFSWMGSECTPTSTVTEDASLRVPDPLGCFLDLSKVALIMGESLKTDW